MIVKLKKGETLAYIAKSAGLSEKEIEDYNGFEPSENEYFVLPNIKRKYVVKAYESPLSVSRKTGLSVEKINERCGVFTAGKTFYY
ncbi:MAG: LysM peptidoglycan-binding domain-containing protein [Clostridia bacterium]|nr:LysM peptidoglycan-binding domain-containing protein [Clostridia bacterium]